MPYVALGRIARALESLPRFHAFFGVTFLSMTQSGVNSSTPITWGSSQEQAIIDEFYAPPGAPPGKPFFVPFGRPDKDSGFWKNPKYSGGTLQRARTTDNFRDALSHPTRDTWSFSADYLQVLENQLPRDPSGHPIRIPVFDLAAWLLREREIPAELAEVVDLFRNEFHLTDEQFSTLFDATTSEDPAHFYYEEPIERSVLIELLGGIPDGPEVGNRSESEIVAALETYIRDDALLSLPEGFVRAFYYALKTQRFVILAGRPGTGKTAFARAFGQALGSVFPGSVSELIVGVGQDFAEPDVIGYEKISGGLSPTELSRALFLSGRPRDIYVVILDEMNLAHVDYYLARILPAIESDAPVELPGLDVKHALPPDAFFVGTVNSFVEEPTRVPLSGPVKRRSNILTMPNALDTVVSTGDRDAFEDTIRNLVRQSKNRYERRDPSLASVLDAFRVTDLAAALDPASPLLTDGCTDVLWNICNICGRDPRTSLTLGVLQDVVEYVALSHGDGTLNALDRQIAQKIVPQLAGPSAVVSELNDYLQGLVDASTSMNESLRSLRVLLDSEDPSTGLVYFPY